MMPATHADNFTPTALAKLWWLTDVPAFIDDRLVEKLYNAVVRPEFIRVARSERATQAHGKSSTAERGLMGGLSVPAFLKLEGKSGDTAGSTQTRSREAETTIRYVHSPERHLQEIVSSYVRSHPDRLIFDDGTQENLSILTGQNRTWDEAEAALAEPGPRPLVFLDLSPGVPILPMSGGSISGKPVLLVDTIVARLRSHGHTIPNYPRDGHNYVQGSRDYWRALMDAYENWTAMDVVNEEFGAGERIDWIDFRLKLGTRERPVHLHFVPAGTSPTGNFAYNLVRRGYKVGLRLVGLLKKGCDLNILALYER